MSNTAGGKIFYSNNPDVLEGVAAGASYTNDGPYDVGNVESSSKEGYAYQLKITDPDQDGDDITEEFL